MILHSLTSSFDLAVLGIALKGEQAHIMKRQVYFTILKDASVFTIHFLSVLT